MTTGRSKSNAGQTSQSLITNACTLPIERSVCCLPPVFPVEISTTRYNSYPLHLWHNHMSRPLTDGKSDSSGLFREPRHEKISPYIMRGRCPQKVIGNNKLISKRNTFIFIQLYIMKQDLKARLRHLLYKESESSDND